MTGTETESPSEGDVDERVRLTGLDGAPSERDNGGVGNATPSETGSLDCCKQLEESYEGFVDELCRKADESRESSGGSSCDVWYRFSKIFGQVGAD